MSQKLKVELQDENGNIYYLHTAADVVFLDDGTTVEAALEKKVTASGGDISNTKLATLAASSASFPVPAAGDTPKTLWGKVKKWQQDCLAKFAHYVLTSAITNQYLNDTSKIPTAALMYLLKQEVNGLNSELEQKLFGNLFPWFPNGESLDNMIQISSSGYFPNAGIYIYGTKEGNCPAEGLPLNVNQYGTLVIFAGNGDGGYGYGFALYVTTHEDNPFLSVYTRRSGWGGGNNYGQ